MIPCPAADTLERFLAADLPPDETEAMRSHVRACRGCQATLDRLSDNAELRRAASLAPEPRGPALRRALDALHATPSPADLSATPLPAASVGKGFSFLGAPARPGDLGTLGDYWIEAEIGRGGMGLVFRAQSAALRRTVAVKVLRPDLDDVTARRRLIREARAAAQCRHDHLVTVHAVIDPPDGLPYLVMEYLAGPTLAARIRERGALEPRAAAALVAQVADGLAAAHAAGLVHRDVKPGNILFDPPTGRAKLADFGLAREPTAAGTTVEGALAGTPAYLSPEQADGSTAAGPGSDVYAVGVTLYEALTGAVPFRGAPHMVLRQVLHDEPRPPRRLNDRVPRDLETVCLKAMAKEPARRYPSAAEFAADLRRFLAGEPVRARPLGPLARGARWCRRRPALSALAAALLLTLAAGVGGVLWQWRRAEAAADAARTKAAEADQQRASAETSLRDALAVVEQYLVSVSEGRLANEPGLQPLRKELLTKARDFYQRFTEEHRDDPRLRRELARAHFRLGKVTYLLDGPARGAAELEKALALQEALAADNPDDPTCQLDLGLTCSSLGVCYENGGRIDDALAIYGRVLAISGRVPADHPAAPEFRLLALRGHINHGKALGQKLRWDEEQADLAQAIDIAAALVEAGQQLPESRRGLAIAWNNLGYLHRNLGRHDQAEEALGRAVAVWQEQLRQLPDDLSARQEVARSLRNLGDLRMARRRPGQAAEVFQQALPVLTALVRDNPAVLEFVSQLAFLHNSLGVCAEMEGRRADARAAYRAGLAALEAAPAGRHLDRVEAATFLRGNLAQCLSDDGEESAGFAEYARVLHETAAAIPDEAAPARRLLLCWLYTHRAVADVRWGRYADAVADWDAALANNLGQTAHLCRLGRARAAARLAGDGASPAVTADYAAAMAELERLDAGNVLIGGVIYDCALTCAACSAAATRDDTIDAAERGRRSEAYAARALALLKRASDQGYFRLPGRAEALKADREFEPLRSRDDFQALLN